MFETILLSSLKSHLSSEFSFMKRNITYLMVLYNTNSASSCFTRVFPDPMEISGLKKKQKRSIFFLVDLIESSFNKFHQNQSYIVSEHKLGQSNSFFQ